MMQRILQREQDVFDDLFIQQSRMFDEVFRTTEKTSEGKEQSSSGSYQVFTQRSHLVHNEDGKVVEKTTTAYKNSDGANAKREIRRIGDETREAFEGNEAGIDSLKNKKFLRNSEAKNKLQDQDMEETTTSTEANEAAMHMEEKTSNENDTSDRHSSNAEKEVVQDSRDVFEEEWEKARQAFDSPFFSPFSRRRHLSLL
eukprot:g2084.t1